jgi:hypothetical protein
MNGSGVEQHVGCLWVAAFMAVGVFVVWKLVVRVARAWGVRVPRDMASWQDEVERTAIEAIRADLYAAQCRAGLVELIGKVPADFDPTLLLGCQVAAGVHRGAVYEAERQGIIRTGTYERVYGTSIDEVVFDGSFSDTPYVAPVPVVDEVRRRREARDPEPRRQGTAPHGTAPQGAPRRPSVPCDWVGGKLVPIGRGRRAS